MLAGAALSSSLVPVCSGNALGQTPNPNPKPWRSCLAHYRGAKWHLKGEGVVCCPCAVPCPCRTNAEASYGHCEATVYLHVTRGYYGKVKLDGLKFVGEGGTCVASYKKHSAAYFDQSASPLMQSAFMDLMASFERNHTVYFPYVRTVPINVQSRDHTYFRISIPNILEMIVDRNWGQSSPPFPPVAASDSFANVIQYAQNIRYILHDPKAHLDFDYSHRQANYRVVDLDYTQYMNNSMLAQFITGSGWFNKSQLQIIHAQHLTIPDLKVMQEKVLRLRQMMAHE